MAYFDTTWYVNFGDGSTTGYYAVAKRPQNAAVAAGQLCRQFTTPAVGSERVYVCYIAGTTANTTDATWQIIRGTITTDGTASWMECTGQTAVNGDAVNTPTYAQARAISTIPSRGDILRRNSGASYQLCYSQVGAMPAVEPAFSDTAGVTVFDGSNNWVSLGPIGNFTGGQAPHARLGNVFGTNWFASGNTVYVGDNHAEAPASSASITLSPSSALLARILCHDHSGSYPPTAGDITTGALLATTVGGSINFTGQGSFYFYGITFSASTGGVNIGANSVGQIQNWYCFDSCSWQTTSNSTGAMSIGGVSTAWDVVIFNNTTVKFGGTSAAISPYFTSFLWCNTGQILASGSGVPTVTGLFWFDTSGRFANITLRNLDLGQLTGSIFGGSNSAIGSLIVQDCKLNAAMTVTRPINSGMNVQLIRSASDATAYKSSRINYEGTETTETSIVRTGGAVDPTGIAQSRKIVTTANAQWLRPFKAEPMAIYNGAVGSPVTVTVYGTAAALPNNDDIWLECEYLGSATDPKGTLVTTTKSSVLASNAAVASDASVWASGPAAPFKLATTITPQLPGYIHARVRAAKISTTYYVDPKIVLS